MWPPSGGTQQIYSNVRGRALIADALDVSTAIGTTPTPFVWPNVRGADSQYDPATGVTTFAEGGFFTSVATWRVSGSASRQLYADAEVSLDGGATWTRGTNSMRDVTVTTTGQTFSLPFSGYFPAGLKLRFVIWASASGCSLITASNNGSTAPAGRLTYSHVIATRLP